MHGSCENALRMTAAGTVSWIALLCAHQALLRTRAHLRGVHPRLIHVNFVLRGLRTALVEAEDFGAGTSSRSTKLVHGGVRKNGLF